jgi:hypothetical protein
MLRMIIYVCIMQRTTILLPRELKTRAEAHARQAGTSLGGLIRQSLEAALRRAPAHDPLFSDSEPYRGQAPRDLSVEHDEHLYGGRA